MKKVLLLSIAFCLSLAPLEAQIVYEDFEGGVADLPWEGINGMYDGVVANPDMSGINSSEFVGSYTTNAGSDFNFAIADLPAPADMGTYGLVKVKIWAPVAPSRALLKFEGMGPAVEKTVEIDVAEEWVEYVFDLSAGASNTDGLTKVLISFHSFLPGIDDTFYWDDVVGMSNTMCYETFENGETYPWNGADGMYNGVVANPDSNSVNGSDSCAMYVKSNMHAYSLLLAETGTPFDMRALNQFQLDVYTSAATQVLLKLEGDGGPPIEAVQNIALANVWQTYTFDFSAAADYDHLTRVIIFFDPGTEESGDTYYFDNLCATLQGACAGVEPIPNMVDDFECNRNATYANGWDSLTVVENPSPNPINNTSMVGRYGDPLGEPWGALVIDYHNNIDLSVNNQLNAKIWAPREVPILFKLEGGASAPVEVFMDVESAGQWVDYTVDFSSEALNSHQRIVFFFNAGNEPDTGDVYYIDQIQWSEQTETVLEDFEEGAFLPWEPLDQQTLLHGEFAVIQNPAPDMVNESDSVGRHTKGTAAFSTLTAVAPGLIDISQKPQYNLDVWAPEGATNVTMQLESTTQGNKEVTRDFQNQGNWETVNFDFSEFQNIDDWVSINLIFNPGVAEEGAVYYFDNLTQSPSTVDPCEGVVAMDNIIDDFECQRNYDVGTGSDLLETVINPEQTVVNSSTQVGMYTDEPNQPWAALCWDFPEPIDLEVFNQLSIMIYADQTAPVLMKMEGGTSPAREIWVDYTNVGEWEKITADFSEESGADHQRVCFFFNGGVDHPDVTEIYYIDNIALEHAPFTGCIINFDDPAFTSDEWGFFPAEDDGEFELVDNPDPTGINTSAKVGKAVEKASSSQPWQGMFTNLPSYVDLRNTKIVRMKVWSPQVISIAMKLEQPDNPNAPTSSGDNIVMNTSPNTWEELTWDFSASPTPLPDDGDYRRVTLIWNIDNIPAEDQTYYFDDIQLEGGNCSPSGFFEFPDLDPMTVYPNPATNILTVENLGKVTGIEVRNLLGAVVAKVWVGNDSAAYLDISNLQPGLYTLSGLSRDGRLVANAKFVKQ